MGVSFKVTPTFLFLIDVIDDTKIPRIYGAYLLKENTTLEKREILLCLKSKMVLYKKELKLE
ncbi:hypothetical protein C4569_01985 [Candidatus Parcubacteria bacterium]|nr:MAG: hypothetical protein C4569_01985 [Candidatus Parcubacteria bacterium]